MAAKIQFKRGLSTNFGTVTLFQGEPAFLTDSGKFYIGDGTGKILINPMDKPAGLDTSNSFTKFKVNEYGQIVLQSNISTTDLPSIPLSQITGVGTAASANTGTSVGNVPVLDAGSKLPLSTIPNIPVAQVTGAGTAAAVDTGTSAGNVPVLDAGSKLPISTIPNIPAAQITGLGTAALANTGLASGNVPVLDTSGKLNAQVLPASAIKNTYEVTNQSEMLALSANVGDVAVRSDVKQTYILKTAPATTLANWVLLLTPVDVVTSVNGQQGVVVLGASNILMTGYTPAASYSAILAADSSSVAIGKLEKNFDNYATKNSPALTGTPTAPTATTTDNSVNIATTAYVKNNLLTYAPLASPTFTGTPKSVTPATADNTTNIATTAYVKSNLSTYAPLDAPTFTGNAKAVTQASSDSTTNIATTAFVQSVVSVIDGGTF